MPSVLVINPNTSVSVTGMVVDACRAACPGVVWEGVTGRIGAPYIASEVAYALAGHAALDAFAQHVGNHDAVLIACFGDPGLLAVREVSPVPVIGLAEASFMAAATQGRFAVVTGGHAWGPMLERFARMHRLDTGLTGIFTVDLTGAQIAQAPERALADLRQACEKAVASGAECIVLGGAALTGLADRLQPHVSVKLLDNVVLGAQAAVERVKAVATRQTGVPRASQSLTGVSTPLAGLLA